MCAAVLGKIDLLKFRAAAKCIAAEVLKSVRQLDLHQTGAPLENLVSYMLQVGRQTDRCQIEAVSESSRSVPDAAIYILDRIIGSVHRQCLGDREFCDHAPVGVIQFTFIIEMLIITGPCDMQLIINQLIVEEIAIIDLG